MKTLHIINGEFYSGAERVQDLLAQGLPEFSYEVWFACVKPDKFLSRCGCDKSKVLMFPMKSRFDLFHAMRIGRYVRSKGFCLIHTHTPRTALLGYIASRFAHVPLVHHLHSPTSRCTERSIRNKFSTVIESLVMRRADRIIAVSQSLRDYSIRMGAIAEKIAVVWNGVPSLPVLSKRDVPDGKWTIGAIALFRPRKGLEILLQAIDLLRKNKCGVRLRAVGEFETEQYQRQIMELVDELGISNRIEWMGFVQDIESEFGKMDIFVLPSLRGEGLPMVILEAMANGVPVVSTKIEGVPEALPTEEYGELVDPGDAEQLAAAIQQFIESPEQWEEIRKNAYKRQASYLSARAMSEGVARVYDRILNS